MQIKHRSVVVFLSRALVLMVALALPLGCAGGARRSQGRTVAIELQIERTTSCSECAEKAAALLKEQDGVVAVRAVPSRPSTFVYYTDGAFTVEEARRVLSSGGFLTRLVWGPAAVTADGHFESQPIDEIPRKQPTLKEISEGKAVAGLLKAGFIPPETESVPVPVGD